MQHIQAGVLASDVGCAVKHDDCDLEVIDTLEVLQAVLAEWNHFLSGQVCGNNVFNDPAHILLRVELEPDLAPWILVLRRGGQICCIAPFFLHDTRLKLEFSVIRLGSLPLRMLKVFGGGFIVAAEDDIQRCFGIVFEHLSQQRSSFGLICLEKLRVATPLWDFCRSKFTRGGGFRFLLASSQVEKVHQIRFPSTHKQYLASLNHSTRQTLRRAARKLCDEKRARLERITKPEQVPWFLDQLDQVFRETWQAKTFGYRSRNTQSQICYLSRIAERGWLRSYLLISDDGPIAFDVGYQYNDAFHAIETGYSQAWANLSPGAVMMYLYIEDMYRENPPALFDFGMGTSSHKRRLANVEQAAATVYLAPRNRWRRLVNVQRGLNDIESVARTALVKIGLDKTVRRFLKHRR